MGPLVATVWKHVHGDENREFATDCVPRVAQVLPELGRVSSRNLVRGFPVKLLNALVDGASTFRKILVPETRAPMTEVARNNN